MKVLPFVALWRECGYGYTFGGFFFRAHWLLVAR